MFQKNICIRSMKVGNVVLMPLTVVLLFLMFYHLREFKNHESVTLQDVDL